MECKGILWNKNCKIKMGRTLPQETTSEQDIPEISTHQSPTHNAHLLEKFLKS
jgi:hypothetical protein